jgi:hypothetical protein
MSLFSVKSDETFEGPHQSEPVVSFGADPDQAEVAMVLVHGRGGWPRSWAPRTYAT